MGYSLLAGLDTRGTTLLTSGRVSSEMMYKAARMRVSRVLTRTSPTDVAVEMAVSLGITLVGYVRGRQFTVFHDEAAA
jgi:FdhD protein